MNAEDLCQYANNAKTHENSEYGKSDVTSSTSRNSQGELFLSQKSFLVCESCFWCASSLYWIEDKDKAPQILRCPNCPNGKVELLPLIV
jgi:hypothetical protein